MKEGPFTISDALLKNPPPDPLPPGWILRKSRSQPGFVYYYHQDSGEGRWDAPIVYETTTMTTTTTTAAATDDDNDAPKTKREEKVAESLATSSGGTLTEGSIPAEKVNKREVEESPPKLSTSKRHKASSSSSTSSPGPKEIRVLHILKKHKASRRPSSWRVPTVTATKEEAIHELQEILEVIQESPTGAEQRATFEELARTESDCTSAKRGGDLGFFGRRKMQPPFEDASFALEIGQLSGIVESSSGVHIILRIG